MLLGTAALASAAFAAPLLRTENATSNTTAADPVERLPIGLSQGIACTDDEVDVRFEVDEEAGLRRAFSNSIPAFTVLDYCPFGIGGLYVSHRLPRVWCALLGTLSVLTERWCVRASVRAVWRV